MLRNREDVINKEKNKIHQQMQMHAYFEARLIIYEPL